MERHLREMKLLRFENDPIIGSGFWTPCTDTHHLSYEQVSDWQIRLLKIGDQQTKLFKYR